MQNWDVIFWIGLILIVLGAVLLPFRPPENLKTTVKLFGGEIDIPSIGFIGLGAVLMLASQILPNLTSTQTTPILPQPNGAPLQAQVPSNPVGTPKAPETSNSPPQSAQRDEEQEEARLKNAAYDKVKLSALASDAHSPQVQADARDRLSIIEKEEERLRSAASDETKLSALASDAKTPSVRYDARRQLQILKNASATAATTPNSRILGYAFFAVINKDNHIRKKWFDIDGKPNTLFPAPNDIIIANDKEPSLRPIPYHWDVNDGDIFDPSGSAAPMDVKSGEKAIVGGDVFITFDKKNGERYAIVPISSFIGVNNPQLKSNFTPYVTSRKILGYVYIGRIHDNPITYSFKNANNPGAMFPAANDTIIAEGR